MENGQRSQHFMFLQTHEGTLRGRVNTPCVFCIKMNLEFFEFQLRHRIYQSIDIFVSQWKDFFFSECIKCVGPVRCYSIDEDNKMRGGV